MHFDRRGCAIHDTKAVHLNAATMPMPEDVNVDLSAAGHAMLAMPLSQMLPGMSVMI